MSTGEAMSEGLVGGNCCLGKVEVNMKGLCKVSLLRAA